MASKQPLDIRAYRGINANHTRDFSQPSNGKNFRTKQGALKTRPGCVAVTPPNGIGAIKSIHSAAKTSVSTRLLVEEGVNLWHRMEENGAWANIKANVAGNVPFNSTKWQDFLILINGGQMLAYDIVNGSIAALQNAPNMAKAVTWKYRLWGWSPYHANAHLLRYCGYDGTGAISKDVWPQNYNLNIGGAAGSPIFDCLPYNTHLVCLTQHHMARVYGDTEENFEVSHGGDIGVYGLNFAATVGETIMWLGQDKVVYRYSGTSPVPLSANIDEFLAKEDFSKAFVFGFAGQFWLVFKDTPAVGQSRVYVFDSIEGEWYIDEYPFVINTGCKYGAYMAQEYLHMGTAAGTIRKAGGDVDDAGTAITTEFSLDFEIENRLNKLKNIKLGVHPKRNFSLSVYATADQEEEELADTVSFLEGSQVTEEASLSGIRGQNVSLRVTTTDRIDELQNSTIVFVPGRVK